MEILRLFIFQTASDWDKQDIKEKKFRVSATRQLKKYQTKLNLRAWGGKRRDGETEQG